MNKLTFDQEDETDCITLFWKVTLFSTTPINLKTNDLLSSGSHSQFLESSQLLLLEW